MNDVINHCVAAAAAAAAAVAVAGIHVIVVVITATPNSNVLLDRGYASQKGSIRDLHRFEFIRQPDDSILLLS